MGLDISLIRITNEQVEENCWLAVDDSPELESKYGKLKRKKVASYGEFYVWFYEEIGYKRKGMIPEFYERYEADEFIFTKKEIDELSKFVVPDRRPIFKEQIESRFIEGETILMIGY